MTLDRTLSHKQHLTKTAGKLKTRNSLLTKLVGTSWGANANILRSSALALCYSVGEYCAPVWAHSAHVNLVDVQLNTTMRLITGTVKPTPLPWLPVLANIEPSAIRRKAAIDKLIAKAANHEDWGLHGDIASPPTYRLSSRYPLWRDMRPEDATTRWREEWKSALVVNSYLVSDPTIRQPGFDLPRRSWSLLNRFRTDQGQCGACLKRWGQATSDLCDCGEIQTMHHIVNSCPLTRFEGGLQALHQADEAAVRWLSRM